VIRASWLVLVLVALPTGALARDVGADLSQDGLDFIAGELPGLLPKSFSHSGFTSQLINCPSFTGGDTDLKVSNVKINLQPGSLTIKAGSGSLAASMTVSGSGDADLAVTRPYACVGSTLSCKVSFTVSNAKASLSLKPTASGGKVHVSSASLSVGLSKSNVSIKLSSCGLASTLANLAMPLFEGYIVNKVRDKIEEVASKEIPDLVEQSLASFTRFDGELAGIAVNAGLDELSTGATGIRAGASLTFTAKTSPTDCTLGSAASPGASPALPPVSWQGEHLAVTAAGLTLQRALLAAWQGGLLCLSSAELDDLGVSSSTAELVGSLLGLSDVDGISVAVPDAPVLALVPGSDPRLTVTLPKVQVALQGTAAQQPTTVTIAMQVDLDAAMGLDALSRAVVLEIKQISMTQMTLSATQSKGLSLSVTLVKQLIESVVVPLLTKQLDGMALLPTVLHRTGGVFDPYYLTMTRSSTTQDHVTVWGKAFQKPASDSTAPETKLENAPDALVKPGKLRLVAGGSDGKTPADLLRYQFRMDGGPWSAVGFARDHTVQLKDGAHKVEARAVDLSGNKDPTPASASFIVDGVQPTVTIDSAPTGAVQAASVEIGWSASDDRTAAADLEVKLVCKHTAPGGGQETLFLDAGFVAGQTQQQLVSLTNGDYTVTVVARDQAGNLSKPAQVSFTVSGQTSGVPGPQPTPQGEAGPGAEEGGCSVGAAAAPRATGWVILALLGLLWRRRGAW
jgi:hypothetical protein